MVENYDSWGSEHKNGVLGKGQLGRLDMLCGAEVLGDLILFVETTD